MIAFYNNKYIGEDELCLSPFTPAFQFGCGFFTTLKYDNDRFYFLESHLRRLKNTLQHFSYQLPEFDYETILRELMNRNDLSRSRIKIMAFEENGSISVLIRCVQLVVNAEPKVIRSWQELRGNSEIYRHKSMNYFQNIHMNRIAKQNGFDDYLCLDTEKQVLETTFSNIFFIKDKEIVTPPSNLPLLPGIVREQLLKQAKIGDYTIREQIVLAKELSEFDGAFITNSIHGIVPVKQIDEITFDTNLTFRTVADLRNGLSC